MREQWGLAIGKGLLVGLLTAIPTSIPSIITITGGVLGTVVVLADGKRSTMGKKI
jgi:hypothetical protein